MANRGRGRAKASMSINAEQLGFAKSDVPPPVLQPPPKYPPLDYKAPPFEPSLDNSSYLLILKRDFADTFHESPNNIQLVAKKKDIERYSDRYAEIVSNNLNYNNDYDWILMPNELKPTRVKRKKADRIKTAKKLKEIDVTSKLLELEEKEIRQGSDDDEEKKEDDDEDKDQDENVEDEDADVDEEMDDGTDYANNYFDNGEGYDEEEDNLDDGPIY